ncbi:MAG TPA: hypothetical protein VKA95_15080 [Nitrososphaeraceae archaeon]|nr:hypothetical protein [Nitrososphaeraceae archaeon]
MFFAGPSGSLSDVTFEHLGFYGNSTHNKLKVGPPDYGKPTGVNRAILKITKNRQKIISD